jgi:hypothetical protein
MGKPMRAEYQQARAWINDVTTFDRDFQADTFTLSMTFLGSLLALHDLTGDGMYLKKASDLADRCDGLFKPLRLIVVGLQQPSACCGSSSGKAGAQQLLRRNCARLWLRCAA